MNSRKIPGKIEELLEIIDRLLGEKGCPWDKEQTLSSMVKNLIEETYELAESIRENESEMILEELGDLQFIVLFLGRLAESEHGKGLEVSLDGIMAKLIRRHPHVFGDAELSNSSQVLRKWEEIKAGEKKRKGTGPLSGVPSAMPPLIKSYRIGEKLERQDKSPWENEDPLDTISSALDDGNESQLGRGLYILVQKARKKGMDTHEALQRATEEIRKRFS